MAEAKSDEPVISVPISLALRIHGALVLKEPESEIAAQLRALILAATAPTRG